MKAARSTLLRACAVALLVLAVSPVTAPFSTCDLLALFGDQAGLGSALLQSTPSSDHALRGFSGHNGVSTPEIDVLTSAGTTAGGARTGAALPIPLRV